MSQPESIFPESDVSRDHPESEHWIWVGPKQAPIARPFVEYMTQHWADSPVVEEPHPSVEYTAARRQAAQARFPDRTLVVPTGEPKVRANDQEYNFRPASDFFWLTSCDDPNTVLVIHPEGHEKVATLYLEDRRDKSTHKFFTDARYGEMWVGPRRGMGEAERRWAIPTKSIEFLEKDLIDSDLSKVLITRGYDHRIDVIVPVSDDDATLSSELAEMRLVKDEYEIARIQEAVDMTTLGFEDVVRALPSAVGKNERVIEGVFNLRARTAGNDVGYRTIAASGAHAPILHWTRNDGEVKSGDLLLLDAGVEGPDLYTSDITRTIPISGTFTPEQREIYDVVLAATNAGIAAIRPGAGGQDQHWAAMRVLAQGLYDLGIISVEPEVALATELPLYKRYIVCGTSHMLGIDVHDCTNARAVGPIAGPVHAVGHVLTVEPGLYFHPNDLTIPEKYRGIGVRIEEDVVVTEDGCRVMSSALPRDPDEIEEWMRGLFARPAPNLGL